MDDDRDRYRDGPDAARQFERVITHVLTVSKAELTKREAAYQKSQRTKKRRGVRPSSAR